MTTREMDMVLLLRPAAADNVLLGYVVQHVGFREV